MTDEMRSVTLKGSDKVVAGGIVAIIIGAAAAVCWSIYLLLPFLITMAANLLWLGGEVFALVVILYGFTMLWMTRDTVLLKFKMFAQNLRRKVISDNPIGAIDASIETFQKKLDGIDVEQVSANGALLRLKSRVRNPRDKSGMLDQAERESALADAAEKLGRANEVSQHAVAAKRWTDAAATVQPMIEDQEFIKGQLDKARQIAGDALADLKNQRIVLSAQYDAYKESQAQTQAFRRFFGASPELQTINVAVDAIEKQTTDTQANIDQLMHQLAPRIAAAQLQHEADAAQALAARAAQKQLPATMPTSSPLLAAGKDAIKL